MGLACDGGAEGGQPLEIGFFVSDAAVPCFAVGLGGTRTVADGVLNEASGFGAC